MDDENARHFLVVDSFFGDARALRAGLDRRFAPRLDPFDPLRFVWEHWEVAGQYRQHRAPARSVFPADAIDAFEARLLAWSASTLGLSVLGSPAWVSSVIDGGYQSLHRDSPNGDWAFSFGLSRPGRARFRGGETMIARPDLLDYWRHGQHRAASADTPLFDEIPPRFNRLIAFDSRIPHAVRMVEGPRDLRDGRVAIQGWMRANGCVVDPRAGLGVDFATAVANRAIRDARTRDTAGLFTVRLEVARDGRVKRAIPIADTLIATTSDTKAPDRARRELTKRLGRIGFGAVARASVVVAPILADGAVARIPPPS